MAKDTADLLRSVRHPDRPAVGAWTVAELAVHMLHVFVFELGVIRRDPLPAVFDFDELGRLTRDFVNDERSRDLQEIADRIEAAGREFAPEIDAAEPDAMYDWLGGSRLPLPALHAHILSECLVHGFDVARADGLRWPMRPDDALAAIDDFFVPLAVAFGQLEAFGGPRAFVNQAAGSIRACFELRLGGARPRHFIFEDRALTVTERADRRVDCYVKADPVALNLVVWGRASPWPAVARGRLLAWGPRPWLAARLPSLVKTP
ncbi:MAG: maleylpyruvate isomerase N-terminal domain-containing protein [Actinomycetota bacterium]